MPMLIARCIYEIDMLNMDRCILNNATNTHTYTHMYIYIVWLDVCIMLYLSLTHWGQLTHTCVSKLTVVGSDNDLSPGRDQTIIWTSAGILLTGPLGTNFSEILIEINIFSFKEMHLKISPGNWQPFCLGHSVLIHYATSIYYAFS